MAFDPTVWNVEQPQEETFLQDPVRICRQCNREMWQFDEVCPSCGNEDLDHYEQSTDTEWLRYLDSLKESAFDPNTWDNTDPEASASMLVTKYKFVCNSCGNTNPNYSYEQQCPACGSENVTVTPEQTNRPRPDIYLAAFDPKDWEEDESGFGSLLTGQESLRSCPRCGSSHDAYVDGKHKCLDCGYETGAMSDWHLAHQHSDVKDSSLDHLAHTDADVKGDMWVHSTAEDPCQEAVDLSESQGSGPDRGKRNRSSLAHRSTGSLEKPYRTAIGPNSGYQFEVFGTPGETYWGVTAYDDGHYIGHIYLEDRGDFLSETEPVFVEEPYRRQGVASDLVAVGQQVIGKEISVGGDDTNTEEGNLWIENMKLGRGLGTQSSFYHVAPRSLRDQIRQQGLVPNRVNTREELPEGIYAFEDLDNAYHYADYRQRMDEEEYGYNDSLQDVYQINPEGFEWLDDPDVDPDDEFQQEYPVPLRSKYTASPIPFDHLGLLEDSKPKYLYHGTLADNSEAIQNWGLTPDIGDFVRDSYRDAYFDDDEFENDIGSVAYLADEQNLHKAMNSMAHYVSQKLNKRWSDVSIDDLVEHGALMRIPMDQANVTYAPEEEIGWGKHPNAVEPDDYYSYDTVYGMERVEPEEMRKLLQGVTSGGWGTVESHYRKSMAMDPFTYEEAKNSAIYHWTKPENVKSILIGGIIPWDQHPEGLGKSQFEGEKFQTRPGHVYMTRSDVDLPSWIQDGGLVPIKVDLGQIDHKNLVADEDHAYQNWGDYDVEEEEIDPTPWMKDVGDPNSYPDLGQWAEAYPEAMADYDATRSSFDYGTLAHKGIIPPNALSLVDEGHWAYEGYLPDSFEVNPVIPGQKELFDRKVAAPPNPDMYGTYFDEEGNEVDLSKGGAPEDWTPPDDEGPLYHLTPSANMEEIMKNGLVPQIGDRTREIYPDAKPYVHAMENLMDMGEYGNWFAQRNEPHTLLELPRDRFKAFYGRPDEQWGAVNDNSSREMYTWYSEDAIPPEEIEVLEEYTPEALWKIGASGSDERWPWVYHMTSAENVPSIMANGLEPRVGPISGQYEGAKPYVYGWEDVGGLLGSGFAEHFFHEPQKPFKVLRMPKNHFQLFQHPDNGLEWGTDGSGREDGDWYSENVIPPDDIEVFDPEDERLHREAYPWSRQSSEDPRQVESHYRKRAADEEFFKHRIPFLMDASGNVVMGYPGDHHEDLDPQYVTDTFGLIEPAGSNDYWNAIGPLEGHVIDHPQYGKNIAWPKTVLDAEIPLDENYIYDYAKSMKDEIEWVNSGQPEFDPVAEAQTWKKDGSHYRKSMAMYPYDFKSLSEQSPYMYHWTEPEKVDRILKEGLRPYDDGQGHRWDPYLTPRPGHVYMMGPHPERSDYPSSGTVPIRIDMTKLDPVNLSADEDHASGQSFLDDEVTNPSESESLGQWAEDNSHYVDDPDNTWESLAFLNSLAHRGAIPPEALSKDPNWDYNKGYEKWTAFDPSVWNNDSEHNKQTNLPICPQCGDDENIYNCQFYIDCLGCNQRTYSDGSTSPLTERDKLDAKHRIEMKYLRHMGAFDPKIWDKSKNYDQIPINEPLGSRRYNTEPCQFCGSTFAELPEGYMAESGPACSGCGDIPANVIPAHRNDVIDDLKALMKENKDWFPDPAEYEEYATGWMNRTGADEEWKRGAFDPGVWEKKLKDDSVPLHVSDESKLDPRGPGLCPQCGSMAMVMSNTGVVWCPECEQQTKNGETIPLHESQADHARSQVNWWMKNRLSYREGAFDPDAFNPKIWDPDQIELGSPDCEYCGGPTRYCRGNRENNSPYWWCDNCNAAQGINREGFDREGAFNADSWENPSATVFEQGFDVCPGCGEIDPKIVRSMPSVNPEWDRVLTGCLKCNRLYHDQEAGGPLNEGWTKWIKEGAKVAMPLQPDSPGLPEFYYHVSPAENHDRIMAEGLVPAGPSGLSPWDKERKKWLFDPRQPSGVYLWDNEDNAMSYATAMASLKHKIPAQKEEWMETHPEYFDWSEGWEPDPDDPEDIPPEVEEPPKWNVYEIPASAVRDVRMDPEYWSKVEDKDWTKTFDQAMEEIEEEIYDNDIYDGDRQGLRYYTPHPISANKIRLVNSRPLTEMGYEDEFEDESEDPYLHERQAPYSLQYVPDLMQSPLADPNWTWDKHRQNKTATDAEFFKHRTPLMDTSGNKTAAVPEGRYPCPSCANAGIEVIQNDENGMRFGCPLCGWQGGPEVLEPIRAYAGTKPVSVTPYQDWYYHIDEHPFDSREAAVADWGDEPVGGSLWEVGSSGFSFAPCPECGNRAVLTGNDGTPYISCPTCRADHYIGYPRGHEDYGPYRWNDRDEKMHHEIEDFMREEERHGDIWPREGAFNPEVFQNAPSFPNKLFYNWSIGRCPKGHEAAVHRGSTTFCPECRVNYVQDEPWQRLDDNTAYNAEIVIELLHENPQENLNNINIYQAAFDPDIFNPRKQDRPPQRDPLFIDPSDENIEAIINNGYDETDFESIMRGVDAYDKDIEGTARGWQQEAEQAAWEEASFSWRGPISGDYSDLRGAWENGEIEGYGPDDGEYNEQRARDQAHQNRQEWEDEEAMNNLMRNPYDSFARDVDDEMLKRRKKSQKL